MTATFKLTPDLFRQLLQLPPEAVIEHVTTEWPYVMVTVEHPDLKAGECLPHYARDPDGNTRFDGWGQ